MTSHFNIQINIQRVDLVRPEGPSSYSRSTTAEKAERVVTDVLKLAVTAATEEEAYAKAHKMLTANQPEPGIPVYPPGVRAVE